MPTVGTDCQIILDTRGYFIEPQSYKVIRPRIRRADLTGAAANPVYPGAGAGERYIDRGPGKRVWSFTIVCFHAIRDYTGTTVSPTGQQYRDALHTSYQKVNTQLTYTDPHGQSWSVWFDDLEEEIADLRSQSDGLNYYCHTTLVEV